MRRRCQRCAAAAGWISVSGNIALAAIKWFTGLLCGSQALLADALHSSVDVLGSATTLVILKLSRRRPNQRYPYGFGKLEDVAAMGIYLILIGAGTFMSIEAIHSIVNNEATAPKFPALIAAALSIGINLAMYGFISCAGKKTNSPSLVALGYENRVDALSSVAALVGIFGATLGFAPLDPLAAVVVSVIIVSESLRELYEAGRNLTDAALPQEERQRIERLAGDVVGVEGVLSLKSRRLGPTAWVDLDVLVAPDISVEAAQSIAVSVAEEARCHAEYPLEVRVYTHPAPAKTNIRTARLGQLLDVVKELRTREQE